MHSIVMADLRGHKFSCRIDSCADEYAILDTIGNFQNSKSIISPTLKQSQTFKTVDRCTVRSSGQVESSPALNTSTVKCCQRNLHMHIVPDGDTSVQDVAASSEDVVLGNSFLSELSLNVSDFVSDNHKHFFLFTTAMSAVSQLWAKLAN